MRTLSWRVVGWCFVLAIGGAACSATETVTISDSAIAAATTTARIGNDPAPTAVPPAPTVDGTSDAEPTSDRPATEAVEPISPAACTYLGLDDFGDMQLEIELTSALGQRDDVRIGYLVTDSSGEVLVDSDLFVEDLAPGERLRVHKDTFEKGPAGATQDSGITCEIGGIEPVGFAQDIFRPTASDVCRFVEIDGFGDIQIELDFTNPTAANDLAIDYALRGPDDVRFGDGVAFVEDVAPAAATTFAVDTFTELPDWVTEGSFSCDILAVQEF